MRTHLSPSAPVADQEKAWAKVAAKGGEVRARRHEEGGIVLQAKGGLGGRSLALVRDPAAARARFEQQRAGRDQFENFMRQRFGFVADQAMQRAGIGDGKPLRGVQVAKAMEHGARLEAREDSARVTVQAAMLANLKAADRFASGDRFQELKSHADLPPERWPRFAQALSQALRERADYLGGERLDDASMQALAQEVLDAEIATSKGMAAQGARNAAAGQGLLASPPPDLAPALAGLDGPTAGRVEAAFVALIRAHPETGRQDLDPAVLTRLLDSALEQVVRAPVREATLQDAQAFLTNPFRARGAEVEGLPPEQLVKLRPAFLEAVRQDPDLGRGPLTDADLARLAQGVLDAAKARMAEIGKEAARFLPGGPGFAGLGGRDDLRPDARKAFEDRLVATIMAHPDAGLRPLTPPAVRELAQQALDATLLEQRAAQRQRNDAAATRHAAGMLERARTEPSVLSALPLPSLLAFGQAFLAEAKAHPEHGRRDLGAAELDGIARTVLKASQEPRLRAAVQALAAATDGAARAFGPAGDRFASVHGHDKLGPVEKFRYLDALQAAVRAHPDHGLAPLSDATLKDLAQKALVETLAAR